MHLLLQFDRKLKDRVLELDVDFGEIKGRPLSLAAGGWVLSLVLGITVVGVLHAVPQVQAPMMVTLALCTTGLGILIPVFRDSGQLATPFGRYMLAAGTLGEVGPIVAMSLLLVPAAWLFGRRLGGLRAGSIAADRV